ncbi:MAG: sulfatase [Planctomycetota bacterium]|nr:sulfatase [Planctomycetota bacterium]
MSSILPCEGHEKPNVLFIAVDDLNDYISPLANHPGIKTPHFEKLARRSVNFTNAHCAAPACHPSRVAVMTGVHPIHSGIYRNAFGAHGPRWRHESQRLEKALVLSQHFRNHGYRAVGGGKLFHTLQWTPGDSQNDPDAWDDYRGDPLDPISGDWPRPRLVPDAVKGIGPGRPLGASQLFGAAPLLKSDEDYGDQLVVDWAIEQIKKPLNQPLFLAVGLFRPHIPWEVSRKWYDLYPLESIQLPHHQKGDLDDAHSHGRQGWHQWVTENQQWKPLLRGYLASVSYVDHQLGRLINALDHSGLKDNTIIVLWSDHGFHLGEKENWEKFALWNQTTRVPLFIDAPGLSSRGSRCHQPVSLTDLYPTLCDLADLPIPSQCDGESLLGQLNDPAKIRSSPVLTSFQFWGEKKPSHALVYHRYRFIRYGNGFEELYDHRVDPNEFENRAQDPSLQTVKERLARSLPGKASPLISIPTDSPFHRKRLNSNASIANRGLKVELTVEPDRLFPDGVLLSHGGNVYGFSIYIKKKKLQFSIRSKKKLHTIVSEVDCPESRFNVEALLSKQGRMELRINQQVIATGKSPTLIVADPNEGQTVGRDPLTPVGDYVVPFAYQGRVARTRVTPL